MQDTAFEGLRSLRNGEIIRVKHGCDGEIYTDVGEPLPEEQGSLAGTIFEPDEIEEMQDDGMDEAEIQTAIEFEAAYGFRRRYPSGISVIASEICPTRLSC